MNKYKQFTIQLIANSAKESQNLAKKILADFSACDIFCLYGDLGSGKTCFTQGAGEYFNIPKLKIKSPTYTFSREYLLKNKKKLYHYDLYRLSENASIDNIGLQEIFDKKNKIIFIEWADRIKSQLPEKRVDIYFENLGKNKRKITINFKTSKYE